MKVKVSSLLLAVVGCAAVLVLPSTTAAAAAESSAALSTLRQDTVDRARAALTNPRQYRLSPTGPTKWSVPQPGYNYLGENGSETNYNQYNDFTSDPWCGYFAAAMWTGVMTPNPANFPRIPTHYASSQAWRKETGTSYHPFRRAVLPRPGDVLVWQNGSGTAGVDNGNAHGHVGVVVSVNNETDRVVVIEGNAIAVGIHSMIARKEYAWDADGPTIADKHFMGHVDRE